MKNIVIAFSGARFEDEPFDEWQYATAYGELAAAITERGHAFFVVRHTVAYLGGSSFEGGWKWQDGKFCEWNQRITADRIFNKSLDFVPDGSIDMVNPLAMNAMCRNKLMLVRRLPSLCPVTRLVSHVDELDAAFVSVQSDLIVVKPLSGSGGDGVFIGTREQARTSLPPYPFLVQEWIDTSQGIPGLVDTHHDFRLLIKNGNVILTFIRSPRTGSLISNVARGGFIIPIPANERPAEALVLVAPVDELLSQHPHRFYTIDCARDRSGTWKIIELNDQPGLMPRMQIGDEADIYLNALCDLLLED